MGAYGFLPDSGFLGTYRAGNFLGVCMVITLIIGPHSLKVFPALQPGMREELGAELTFTVPNYIFTQAYKTFGWDGKKCLFYKDQTAPSGLARRIIKFFEENDCHVNVKYLKDYEALGSADLIGINLDAFQIKAINAAVENRYGIIHAPIRSGKTEISSGIIKRINQYPTWVVTSAAQGGREVVTQTQKNISLRLGVPVGLFSESRFEPADVVVTSYEALKHLIPKKGHVISDRTLERNRSILESITSAKVLLLDECHHAFSQKSDKIIKLFKNIGYKIGLSGTPKPNGATKLEVEAGIGPIIAKGSFNALIKSGRLAKPLVFIYELPERWFPEYTYASEYSDIYWSRIVTNEHRNRFIAETANSLIKKQKRVYIIVRRKEHGRLIQQYIAESVYIEGDCETEKRKWYYSEINAGRLLCIISTVGKEGLNIPNLDAVINAEGLASPVATVQKMRSLTAAANKKYGIVIDFIDRGKYLYEHSIDRVRQYSKYKEFIVTKKLVPPNFFEEKSCPKN